jgi:hypothetical protein
MALGELLLQLVADCTQALVFDGCGRQLVLVVHEIKIKNRNGLEICAMRLQMRNAQGSAQ